MAAALAVGAAMLSATCRGLAPALRGPRAPSAVAGRCLLAPGVRSLADQGGRAEEPRTFHPALLRVLVCPLSKKPLRYDESTNELINEELGIAYPIIDGIPNMIPQAARTIHQNKKQEEVEQP
ncbi:protein preY, mitochondrial [Phodopus roborovskii]|nr:protein preY, mitochondrial [Phodopus roborovskii]